MDLLNNAITSFEPTAQEENETWVYYSIGKNSKSRDGRFTSAVR